MSSALSFRSVTASSTFRGASAVRLEDRDLDLVQMEGEWIREKRVCDTGPCTPHNGTPHNSTPHNGTPHNGTPHNGTPPTRACRHATRIPALACLPQLVRPSRRSVLPSLLAGGTGTAAVCLLTSRML